MHTYIFGLNPFVFILKIWFNHPFTQQQQHLGSLVIRLRTQARAIHHVSLEEKLAWRYRSGIPDLFLKQHMCGFSATVSNVYKDVNMKAAIL